MPLPESGPCLPPLGQYVLSPYRTSTETAPQFLFFSPCPISSLKKNAIVHRLIPSNYAVVSLILFSLCQRVTGMFWLLQRYADSRKGRCQLACPATCSWLGAPQAQGLACGAAPIPSSPQFPYSGGSRIDGAGTWRKTKCGWDTDCP